MMPIPLMRIVLNIESLLPHTAIGIVKWNVLTIGAQHLHVDLRQDLRIQSALLVTILRAMTLDDLILLEEVAFQIRLIGHRYNVIVVNNFLGNIAMWSFLLALSIQHVLVMLAQSILEVQRATAVGNVIVEVKVDEYEENDENCENKIFSLNSHHHRGVFSVNFTMQITDTSFRCRVEPRIIYTCVCRRLFF